MRRQIHPPKIYGIADQRALGRGSIPQAVETMAQAGIEWIQIRAKQAGVRQLISWIESSLRRLEGSGAHLWINDRVDLVALFPTLSVHLGQRDLPPADARAILGQVPLIGHSTHGIEQLKETDRDLAVDVVALGPIFGTRGKESPDPVIGLRRAAELRSRTTKPLVAIGGIDAENLAEVFATGVDTVAVISALCRGNLEANCKRLLRAAEDAG